MVTVGTAVASSPPYRSRRALLTHRAPPSDSCVEAVTRQRVHGSDWRKEAGDELDEPLPAEACRLAASPERCEPEPLHLVEEPPQARVVTRDCEVVQMPFQHLLHPSTGFHVAVMARLSPACGGPERGRETPETLSSLPLPAPCHGH